RIRCGQSWIGGAGGAGLVVCGHGEGRLGDVGGGCRLGEAVIGGVGPAERQATHRHRLGRADGLAGKSAAGGGSAQGDRVSAHCPRERSAAQIKGRRGRAVINLVVGGEVAHGQSLGRDVRYGRGRGVGCIIG